MAAYAEGTDVGSSASLAEIERTVRRFGARAFASGWDDDSGRALVSFVKDGRQVRFVLTLPDRRGFADRKAANGVWVKGQKQWEQAVKERWRALALVIKSKLVAVETGIVSFEVEFAMWTVMPDGRTAQEHVMPALQHALDSGQVQPMMAALEAGSS
jgi:hypothetical protein